MKQLLYLLFFVFLAFTSYSQIKVPKVEIITQGTKTSLRGLSVVNDRVIWVSGSNGTVGKSTDGGKTWKWVAVNGFEKRDFRDIHAFDATTAVVIAIDAPAFILRTVDGGQTWKTVYQNNTKGMFLDALEFWNEQAGIAIGDPIDGKIFIARTFDGGDSWMEIPDQYKPRADSGESFFAASGTNIAVLDKDEAVFVSGGIRSRIFIRDQVMDLPVIQGKQTTGANSVAVMDANKRKGGKTLMVVGGDFNDPASDSLNCFFSKDRGRSWMAPKEPPHGYRSCVIYLSETRLISCGLTGVDYSYDGGNHWQLISKEGFHACGNARNGASIFLVGGGGKVGKIAFDPNDKKFK
ncbi:oxidoreductase [Chitinophagaceae bacterium LB-8]|uniref:Oxidoreductase n=1 Tax=Paraflavisolibacter caeni TaxID=2982496 RepID=A0A9X3BIY2_9BACT|nr:oxidoreductase [Paraflavisolibacter caeni]MCU7550613.1 oxidoreductase [Paraflavisolibacter caeni]